MKVNLKILISLLSFMIIACGQIIPGSDSNIKNLVNRAKKNMYKAETIEDLKQRNGLLDEALGFIKQAELLIKKDEKNKKDFSPEIEISYGFALYFYVRGDNLQSKKNLENAKSYKTNNTLIKVLETRILIKEKGKDYAKDAVDILNYIIKNDPDMAEAHLSLGDSYYYLMDFNKSRIHYRKVLFIGGDLQVLAAERLETLDEIEKLKIDPKQFQNILFSKAVSRGEIADLLQTVFRLDRYLRFSKPLKEFADISGSMYSKSIELLRSKGLFSYIESDKFEPFKSITRREMAKIVEDFLVISTGNMDYRSSYPKNIKSPIVDVDSADIFYNAIRISVKENIIGLSLGGSMQPENPVEGLEAVGIFNKMIKRFAQ